MREEEQRRMHRSALTRTLAGLYCLICGVFGAVFPISDALTYAEGSPFTLTHVFLLYLYIVSIIILIYFFTAVFRGGLPKEIKSVCASDQKSSKNAGPHENGSSTIHNSNGAATGSEEITIDVSGRKTKIAYHGEGMNLYIRIGAAVFTVGSAVYKGIRIVEPFENDHTQHCIHTFSIFVDVVFVVFMFMQTFLIFKHHQIVINLHKAAVRICLMHLLATNLALWISACAREIVEDLNEETEKAEGGAHQENATAAVSCREPHTIADEFAPYLFPCIIEYSLIGAAAVYRIYLNVAKPDEHEINGNGSKVVRPPPLKNCNIDCSKATPGLVIGILTILATIASVVVFYILDSRNEQHIATYVFLATDIILLLVTMVTVVWAILRMRGLAFVAKEEDSFDDKLLVISLSGFYFYSCFIILSSARSDDTGAFVAACFLIRELLAVVQITVQTVMILDGFRRRAENEDHVHQKPGRAILTFLLACNFSLWIVNTFEIKRAEISDIHVDYYSKIAWRLVVHFSLPLVIFYRFHSTVCLSDIWEKAYEKEKDE